MYSPEQANEEQELVAGSHGRSDYTGTATKKSKIIVPKNITCCGRLKLICCPVKSFKNTEIEDGDKMLEIVLIPEAFRMWFYLYFILFTLLGAIITTTLGDLDYDDNPVINRFGTNNPCIYFDIPPFSTIGATLYFPAVIILLMYEILDLIRVYDHHIDSDGVVITRCFYIYYTISTILESVGIILFLQIFATSPFENIYVHTWPYYIFTYSVWLISLKRFSYLWVSGAFNIYHGLIYALGCFYVFIYFMTIVIRVAIGVPNLYNYRLWETYPWTSTLADINGEVYNICVFIIPIIFYIVITKDLKTIKIIINRSDE